MQSRGGGAGRGGGGGSDHAGGDGDGVGDGDGAMGGWQGVLLGWCRDVLWFFGTIGGRSRMKVAKYQALLTEEELETVRRYTEYDLQLWEHALQITGTYASLRNVECATATATSAYCTTVKRNDNGPALLRCIQ
jgi:hypothetical protein